MADIVRVAACVSVVAVGLSGDLLGTAVLALALLGAVVPRFLGVRPALDLAFATAVLVAAWSSIFDLYTAVAGWDDIVHFFTNGATAALLFVLLARLRIAPSPQDPSVSTASLVVLTVAFGLSTGVLWEIAEWAGHTYIDPSIFVEYNDTIGDLVVDGLGALAAGVGLRFFSANNRSVQHPRTVSSH